MYPVPPVMNTRRASERRGSCLTFSRTWISEIDAGTAVYAPRALWDKQKSNPGEGEVARQTVRQEIAPTPGENEV
jgi:hypothetical protein